MSTPGLAAAILKLAARAGGVHSLDPELSAWSQKAISGTASRLTQQRRLWPVKRAQHLVLYFTDKAHALNCVTGTDSFKAVSTRKRSAKEQPAMAAKPTGPMRLEPDAQVVYTADTKYTVCPAFTPRFQEHTLEHVHGGLQRGRVTL